MSKTEQMEVLIAVYLFEDLGKKDYEAVMDLVEADEIQVQGVVLATKDEEGEMKVIEAGDHAVRKGATMLGGAGLVVGLFAPPLLAATAVGAGIGAAAGKLAKHRVESGIGDKLDDVLPDGSAALIAIYDSGDADRVKEAIPNAIRSSVAQIDGHKAKELKAGLEEASAGLSG
jgi:arylsulfatase